MKLKIKRNIDRKSIIVVIVALLIIAALIISFFIIRQRKREISENRVQIEKCLSDLESFENEAYFNSDYINDISDIESSSKKAFEKGDLNEIVSINKEVTDLRDRVEQEIARYNELYTLLQDEMSRTIELQNNYFAKDYDTSKINQTKDKVQNALSESQYLEYEQLYKDFSGQNDALSKFINNALNDIYSVQTNTDISKDYPFAVSEADVLDEPPCANLFIDDSSAEYNFSIHQVETKEITVQDESGSLQKALVNTEVNFDMKDGYSIDEYTALNERPAYLFKDKNEKILLALKNYDGEDYYVLYSPQ